MPVWSKLKSGRIPQGNELFDIIGNQLSLSKSGEFDPSKVKSNNNSPPPQMPNHEADGSEFNEDQNQHSTEEHAERSDFKEFDEEEKEEL